MTDNTKIDPVELVKALLFLINEAVWPDVKREGAIKIAAISQMAERYLAQTVPVKEPEESADE